ncbi:MAG: hypothetical protein R3326_08490 [Gemmatimonadota bacterium]|nr:hypothetical protein [Gemmatimonadota bacterium]
MSCLTAQGKPGRVACGMLRLLRHPGTPEKAALCFGLPLREVREDLRELAAAGYVIRVGSTYRTTGPGRRVCCRSEQLDPVC